MEFVRPTIKPTVCFKGNRCPFILNSSYKKVCLSWDREVDSKLEDDIMTSWQRAWEVDSEHEDDIINAVEREKPYRNQYRLRIGFWLSMPSRKVRQLASSDIYLQPAQWQLCGRLYLMDTGKAWYNIWPLNEHNTNLPNLASLCPRVLRTWRWTRWSCWDQGGKWWAQTWHLGTGSCWKCVEHGTPDAKQAVLIERGVGLEEGLEEVLEEG